MRKFYSSENGYIEKDNWQPECWVNIECPDEQDYMYLSSELGVPKSFLDSAADNDERPRFDHEDGWLLTILRIPFHTDDSEATEPYGTLTFAIITKEELIITISSHSTDMIESFIEHTRKKHIIDINKPDFILHIIYMSTFWFLKYLKAINVTVASASKGSKKNIRNKDLFQMMQLQNSLVYFNTALKGNTTLVDRLDKVFEDNCNEALLEDVKIELQQAQNTVDVYIEILDSTMDMLASVISNNVNDIMKKMTSVSIILMLPTLIASFYGMNVAVAFGGGHYAFWGIIGVSIAIALIIFFWLKHIKWM